MQKVLTAEEMREVDRLTTERYGIPSILLMENAAHAAARVITEKLGGSVAGKLFLILCGKGNNGGDGAALARILWTLGANIYVTLFSEVESAKGEARINFEILEKIHNTGEQPFLWLDKIPTDQRLDVLNFLISKNLAELDVVVDALFGTGLGKPINTSLKEVCATLAQMVNEPENDEESKILFISLDMPSGLLANEGNLPTFAYFEGDSTNINAAAKLTITFTAPKPANVLAPASSFNGELVVANIGSPPELIENSPSKLFVAEKQDARDWLEKTKFIAASYKNKRGHALVVGGAKNYAGAAILAGNAAIVSGVGLATVAAPESVHNAVASRMLPEVMTRAAAETPDGAIAEESAAELLEFIEGKIDAVAVGSGMSSAEDSTKRFVREFVEKRKTPVVIDADGLNALAPFDLKGADDLPLILTPHEGEFLRLLGTKDKEVLKDRVRAVRDFAEKRRVILVLKGERILIGAPDGRVVVNPTGNSGLGKAGNGDTLTGIIAGFIAQAAQMKIDVYETVVAAVYVAGLAGDVAAEKFGKRSMLASDVRDCLQAAFERIEN